MDELGSGVCFQIVSYLQILFLRGVNSKLNVIA